MQTKLFLTAVFCLGLGFIAGAAVIHALAAPVQERMLASVKQCTVTNANLEREIQKLRQQANGNAIPGQHYASTGVVYSHIDGCGKQIPAPSRHN